MLYGYTCFVQKVASYNIDKCIYLRVFNFYDELKRSHCSFTDCQDPGEGVYGNIKKNLIAFVQYINELKYVLVMSSNHPTPKKIKKVIKSISNPCH